MLSAVAITYSIASFISFVLYGVDKFKAKRGGDRIPEIVLLIFCALGGAIGTFFGMICFHHKTNMERKWHFSVVVIASVFVQFFVFLLASGAVYF